ncbi:hypothetical protein SS50377_23726 [Spironucleus salmonicida]|uniref:Uncharacterized protein n=1 Tax=Spironucleus salmonicida TaxID=348837 RepID=V6LP73_9EUKA|nr:hypothetical protein SS50377_23726 [Spironucleus salmonicida]|eukprot:EST46405.1 Hypothetical protein SS50377_13489 [Spironucleus salmonicida]
MNNLPSDPQQLKKIVTKLLTENHSLKQHSQTRSELTKSVQNLSQNPQFSTSILLSKNQELQCQLQEMLETQKAAKREIITIKSELHKQNLEWKTQLQLNSNKQLTEYNDLIIVNQNLQKNLTHYTSFLTTIKQLLNIQQQDIDTIELEAIGEVETMKQIIQNQQIQISEKDHKIDDMCETQNELLEEIQKVKNEEQLECFELQIQELASLLELQQAQIAGLRSEKSILNTEKSQLEKEVQSLSSDAKNMGLATHLLVPLNEKIEELTAENQRLKDEVSRIINKTKNNEHVNQNSLQEESSLKINIQASNQNQINNLNANLQPIQRLDSQQQYYENSKPIYAHIPDNLSHSQIEGVESQFRSQILKENTTKSQLLGSAEHQEDQEHTLDSLVGSLIQSSQQDDLLKQSQQSKSGQSISVEDIDHMIHTKHNDLYARVMQRRLEKQKLKIEIE